MIDLKQNTLPREIPPNLLVDEKVVRMAKSLQVPLVQMLEWADKINYKMSLNNLDESIIDHLLWESHITWHEGLSMATTKEQKMNLIKSSVKLHRLKGTPAAIELVLDILNFNGEVQEWFEYEGRPYYFRVFTEQSLLGVDIEQLAAMIKEFKNTRSWLENITVHRKLDLGLQVGGAYPLYQRTHINAPSMEIPELQTVVSLGMVSASYQKTELAAPQMVMPNFSLLRSFGGVFSIYKNTVIKQKGVV